MTPTGRHSSRVAARVVVAAAVVLVVIAGALVWRHHADETYVVPSGVTASRGQAVEQPAEAAAALSEWSRAITDRAPEEASGDAARIATQNAARLQVEDFTARYVAAAGAVDADGAWTADVALTWRFAGVDTSTAAEEVGVTFRPVGSDAVEIAGFGGGDDRLPLWLSTPVLVRRTDGVTVVLAGSDAAAARRAERFVALGRQAVATVRRVLPWPDPDLVLEVPADESGVEQMMGADAGSYHGVAAVTATVDGSTGGPVHVLVNPQVIGDLNSQGAQIVLSHEATHVATRVEGNTSLPPWLLEGFADYVALRDVSLPLSTTARQIFAEVRQDGAPRALPGSAEFNDQSETFGAQYEAAWLACRLLARIGGEPALVGLYDAVRDGADLDATMRHDVGLGVAAFTARWRAELTSLAAQGRGDR